MTSKNLNGQQVNKSYWSQTAHSRFECETIVCEGENNMQMQQFPTNTLQNRQKLNCRGQDLSGSLGSFDRYILYPIIHHHRFHIWWVTNGFLNKRKCCALNSKRMFHNCVNVQFLFIHMSLAL
jgi:hypothetical protein